MWTTYNPSSAQPVSRFLVSKQPEHLANGPDASPPRGLLLPVPAEGDHCAEQVMLAGSEFVAAMALSQTASGNSSVSKGAKWLALNDINNLGWRCLVQTYCPLDEVLRWKRP